MNKTLIVLLALTVALGGCGRKPKDDPMMPSAEELAARDKRPLVAQVTNLTFDRYPGGVILRATGLPPDQGWWDADLVSRGVDANGVQTYDFRVSPPDAASSANTVQSRQITAAVSISDIKLQSIRRIVVQGASNALTVTP